MSFIFDDKSLIDKLLNYGIDFESKYAKGQAAPVNPDVGTLQSLISNLEKEIYPDQKNPNVTDVSTNFNEPVSLTSDKLENLGALTEFLARSQITVNGSRVAYTQAEEPNDPSYQLYKLEPAGGLLEVQDRSQVTNGYFVNKDLLTKYLVSLQGNLAKTPNPVLGVQLNKLIEQSNKLLDTKIGNTYKELEKTLPDTQVLDQLPKVIKLSDYSADGPAALTFGDIKSAQSFNNWLKNNAISVDLNGLVTPFQSPKFDNKEVLKTLHEKAKYLLSKATNDELKNRYTIYLKQLEALAGTLTGADGKPFSLGENSDENNPNGDTSKNPNGAPGTGAGATGNLAALLSQIGSSLPFNNDTIEFANIRDFFAKYKQVVAANKNPQQQARVNTVLQSINQAEQLMQTTSSQTNAGMQSFPMNLNVGPSVVKAWLPAPQGNYYLPVLNHLSNIMSLTYNVVRDLANAYGKQIGAEALTAQADIFNKQFNALRVLEQSANVGK